MDLKHHLIFIVEDNETYSLMLDYTLTNESVCRISSFSTGEECLRNLYLRPSLIILDQTLPGMDGRETLKHIKYSDPDIPVVIITANEDVDAARNFLNKGIDKYLIKGPDTVLELAKCIDRFCNSREMPEKAKGRKMLSGTMFGILFFIVLSIVVVYMVI